MVEEENKKQEVKEEKKIEEKKVEGTTTDNVPNQESTPDSKDIKSEENKDEKVDKKPKKKDKKEKPKPEIVKKDKAVVRGKDLGVSTKQCVAICNFIRKRKIEDAISDLQQVIKKKIAVPMTGEIPHRKGKGMMSGRYPEKACKIFIKLLKSLHANSVMGGMENVFISVCKANIASRPHRRFGQSRFKRTHVYLEAKEIKQIEKPEPEKLEEKKVEVKK